MKKTIIAILAAAASMSLWAAKTGSQLSDAKTIKIGGSASVKLVKEYDEFDKSYDEDSGVYWYKVKLTKGGAYTVWIQGGKTANMDLDIDTDPEDDDAPMAAFDIYEGTYRSQPIKFAQMAADSWDDDDVSAYFYIGISGDVGATATLSVVSGVRSFSQTGDETSPLALSFTTSEKTATRNLIDGNYYFKATLQAGLKYRLRTTGGTAAKPYGLNIDSVSDTADFDVWEDPAYTNQAVTANRYNDALVIVPQTKGTYIFQVSDDTKSGDNAAGKFGLKYYQVPKLAIGSHKAFTLSEENGWTAQFVPGRMSVSDKYYDDIIDEHLCVISLAKGDRMVFETDKVAVGTCEMIVYDSKGTAIARNSTIGNGSLDMRAAVTASAAGKYYVGVYDTTLDVGDSPETTEPITLTAKFADQYAAADDFDPADDEWTGAVQIVPNPATTNDTLEAAGSVSANHALNGGDWYDWFSVACRQGQTYTIRADYADSSSFTDVALGYDVYIKNAKGTLSQVKYTEGTNKVYVAGESLDEGVTIKAYTNATHYIKVYTKVLSGTNYVAAVGQDYPDYRIVSTVSKDDTPLGLLKVGSTGVAGTFTIGSEKTPYPMGSVVAVPAGDVKVNYGAVAGFAASPASETVSVTAWSTDADRDASAQPVATATGVYSDIYDAKYVMSTTKKTTTKTVNGRKTTVTTTVNNYSPDDGDATVAGAFSLGTLTNTVKTVSRSLYAGDPADNFKFTAAAGRCYNLSLADYAAGGAEGAVMTVSNAVDGVVAENVKFVSKLPLSAGLTYVTVTHGEGFEDKDGSYSLKASAFNTGTVGFSAANFSVKESAEYATLTLKRTAKQGAVKLNWTTEAGTAEPGKEYYPASGVVEWASGDMANKTIKIRLVPDLEPVWESNKVFTVRTWANEAVDFEDNEYPAIISRDRATVTIGEITTAVGTVQLTGYGTSAGGAFSSVANVKSPVVSGEAGDPLVLRFSRTGGVRGNVAIRVTTPGKNGKTVDTAKAKTDYIALASTENVIEWAEGDGEDKYLTISTVETSNYTYSKQFTLAIAALTTGTWKGYVAPGLSAKVATAKLMNKSVGKTAAAFATTTKAAGAVQAVTGTWFVDKTSGAFRSGTGAGTVQWTLSGPGFFAVKPRINNGGDVETPSTATLKMQIGALNAKKAFVASETIDCLAGDVPERITRMIASGSKIVKFTFKGGNGKEYVEFENDADSGLPFKWVRLATATAAKPMAKSVVTADGLDALKWNLPAALANEDVYVQARFGTVAKPAAAQNLGEPAIAASSAALAEGSLAAGKTYYWTLAFATKDESVEDLSTLAWVAHPTVWNFSVLADGNPETSIGGDDAAGDSATLAHANGEPVRLVQGVKCNTLSISGTGSANRYRLLAGKLPTGLSLNATTGKITGTPTASGDFTALLQSFYYKETKKNGKVTSKTYKYGSTIQVDFAVEPMGLAIGAFRGAADENGDGLEKQSAKTGFLTVSVTSAGKITATARFSGNNYVFSGTGFDEMIDEDEDAEEGTFSRKYSVSLKNITKLSKKTTKTVKGKKTTVTTTTPYTNTLDLVVYDAENTSLSTLGAKMGEATLSMMIPNALVASATTMQGPVEYTADLYRAAASVADGKTALAPFAGYYTVSLPPVSASSADGVPTGNGYLTLTVAASGAVTIAGTAANGTAISASSQASLLGSDISSSTDPSKCVLAVPVHWSSNVQSISGLLKFAYGTDSYGYNATVADSTSFLKWHRDAAAAATRDGTAFTLELAPSGGWYNTKANVQRYYLDSDLAIQAAQGEDLPEEALANGYEFKTDCTPNDLEVKLSNNAASVAAKSLVKESSTLLYDLAKSVNPWATTFSYVRATGLVSGQFNAWTETTATTKQVQITKIPHKGVMLFNIDETSPLDANVWSAGYFLIPATTSWKASLPFNVIATPVDGGRDWNEQTVPGEEGLGD